MTAKHVPVTLGSPQSHSIATPTLEVISAWFPPHAQLHSHTHPRSLFGLMLTGSFRTSIMRRDVDYAPATAWSEPAEERHANVAGARGARVVIIQPVHGAGDFAQQHRALFDEIVHGDARDLVADGARLAAECAHPDDLSPLVIDGLALALLARSARLFRPAPHHARAPRWMQHAVDYLHAHCFERVQLSEVARLVGVDPSRLAHEFRSRLQTTPGGYLRALRLDWAAEQLLVASSAVADVALRAGFYDQSHFTRAFRRRFGTTPDRWRRDQPRLTNCTTSTRRTI